MRRSRCFSKSRRNDADLIFAPIGIDDHQKATKAVQPEGDETHFVMIPVFARQRHAVVEHPFHIGQIDAVLVDIDAVLDGVKRQVHAA